MKNKINPLYKKKIKRKLYFSKLTPTKINYIYERKTRKKELIKYI